MTIFHLQILRLIFPHVRGIFLSHFLTGVAPVQQGAEAPYAPLTAALASLDLGVETRCDMSKYCNNISYIYYIYIHIYIYSIIICDNMR